jgi:dinuclear metal center YbgI/SA1388 family protein
VEDFNAGGTVPLRHVTEYLDDLLRIGEVPDYPGALNGLQVESSGAVRRIAGAVDASQETIDAAVAAGANLLLVHHGLFWDGNQPMTGRRYRRMRSLLSSDTALYGAHLPLDVHPEYGNNVLLARELEIEIEGRFGDFQGEPLGFWGRLELRREALAARLDAVLGARVRLVPGGPERIRTVGVITGGAGGMIAAARDAGLDAFITGEGAHQHYFDAREGGINLLLGGHYATETWGVRALARHLGERFGVPWEFLDQPTGF